ncbi:uncharacterized protein ASPGLDRAFT_49466 [Aspergillus glaucus CBS 516.65]|uniref:Secreted protein n=1 Tax=Aspergillus glaucus CBS 516.65 TaxID=1160497 RepID=A0A1L9VDU3_ASPGL|nr:hypothetical protein ASPGLDRAFT_49466 [Aspergillus glaucus CBS 516.65]OJJ82076.1 hypothetical protein ASPGLDRAFT_49466 [Aspergillus glaucus CBS 516.65]
MGAFSAHALVWVLSHCIGPSRTEADRVAFAICVATRTKHNESPSRLNLPLRVSEESGSGPFEKTPEHHGHSLGVLSK